MLKTLLKKQFLELKNLFFPVKNGKRNKKGFFATAAGVAVLMAIIAAAFIYMAYTVADVMCAPLAGAGLSWLYFCLVGLYTVAIGAVFGIIAVYSSVYRATDTELLLSLPIKPSLIVFTRIAGNYFVDLFITVLLWIPFSVKYFAVVSPTALSVVFCILGLFFIPLLCSAIALALGFIVSLITMKFKNNGIVVAVIGLIAIAGFYVLYFKMGSMLDGMLADPENAGAGFKTWGFLFYRLGLAATGDAFSALIFFGISLAAFAVCYTIISLNFIKMSTTSAKSGKVKAVKTPYKTRSLSAMLLKRETGKFFSNANYILNCGLSAVFIVAIGVAVIALSGKLNEIVATLSAQIPVVKGISMLIIPALLVSLLFVGGSAIPSVSLEGKTLWVIRSLPVKSKDVLMTKEYFQLILTFVPSVFCSLSASIVLGGDVFAVISTAAFGAAAALFSAAFSLFMGILKADVNWTNETVAIKSNIAVLIVMLVGYALMIALCAIYYFIVAVMELNLSVEIYLSVYTVILLVLFFVLNKVIATKGVEKFESL